MSSVRISPTYDSEADVVLFQGDCAELLPAIPDGSVSLVVTSPPYNLGKSYEKRVNLADYVIQQKRVIEQCVRVLSPKGSLCWQVGNYVENGEIVPLDIVLFPIFSALHLSLRNRIVWHFEHGLHTSKRFSGRYEVILWFTKGDGYTFNLDSVRVPQKYPQKKYFKGPRVGEMSGNPLGKNPGDLWIIPNVKSNHVEKTIHPCQFPVELVERLVLALTNQDDWVLDPYMGVGSTAIAALMHRRSVMGAEIVPEYVSMAQERIGLGEQGHLRIRPMERSVYDPQAPERSVPPRTCAVRATTQSELALSEQQRTYDFRRGWGTKIVYEYSHLGGTEILMVRYPDHLKEITEVIAGVKPTRSKISREKTNGRQRTLLTTGYEYASLRKALRPGVIRRSGIPTRLHSPAVRWIFGCVQAD